MDWKYWCLIYFLGAWLQIFDLSDAGRLALKEGNTDMITP